MEIIIAISSILIITLAVWLLDKVLLIKICPICAGVAGTWIWIFVLTDWQLIAGILVGGSVVGIAYQTEKYLSRPQNSLIWKVLFMPAGFATAYFLISKNWMLFFTGVLTLILIALIFFRKNPKSQQNTKVEKLKKQMEGCC